MTLDSPLSHRIRDLERQLTITTAQRDTARAAWDMAMEQRAVVLKLHSERTGAYFCNECKDVFPCMTRVALGAA